MFAFLFNCDQNDLTKHDIL